jgi:exopolysaccharide production protein ExoQ
MLPPALAASIWFTLLIFLFLYDPASKRATSPALWLPSIWMFFAGSRLPAQWFGLTPITATTAFEEGSGLDRVFFLVLTLLGLWILARRRVSLPHVFASNSALTLFIVFALASVTWSDFPFISFKRWIRDLTMYVMVLVVLSDTRPFEAVVTVLRRFSYLLLFLSVVLIKYYPDLGVTYNVWTGAAEYTGATTSKNMLGVVCLISGLFLFWDTVERWPQRRVSEIKRVLLVNTGLIAMTLWLLNRSQSATSQSCFIVGCLIIGAFSTKWVKVNPRRLTATIPPVLAAYLVLELAFDFSSSVVAPLLGRDPTLTGRTEIWNMVLALRTNPFLGVGYQAFWLGDRLAAIVSRAGFLNEAHNGYLETYLNLGFVGLALLSFVMIFSYRTIRRRLTLFPHFAPLSLAFWVIMLIYNVTEAAFGAGLLWSVFLLCVIVVPRPTAKIRSDRVETQAVANMRTQNRFQLRASLPSPVRRTVSTT